MAPRTARQWSVLRAEVRQILRETSSTNSFWSDALLLILWNQQYDLRIMELANQHEGWITECYHADIVAGQREYSMPAGLITRVKRVNRVYPLGGNNVYVVPLTRFERFSEPLFDNPSSGVDSTPTYRFLNELLILEPTPGQSVTGGLRLDVENAPAHFSLDTDTLPAQFPDLMETMLVYDTAQAALAVEGSQGNLPEAYVDHILRLRQEYAARFFELTSERSFGRVFSSPFHLGD